MKWYEILAFISTWLLLFIWLNAMICIIGMKSILKHILDELKKLNKGKLPTHAKRWDGL